MAAPKPALVKLTDEEKLRDNRVLICLREAVGGYHVDSVATKCRCSNVQAAASLRRLAADGKVEEYTSFANSRLWRVKK